MKIHAADTVTIALSDVTLTVRVEDASKGDVISGKVETVSGESQTYKVGGVYEFPREALKANAE